MPPGVLTEVIATVMSNLGLERALKRHGIGLVRTPVGDKYVLQEMLRRNAPLGGEQSGHIIFRDYATTGDGLLTALRVFEAMRESGQDLDALTRELETYPQLLVNVRVKNKRPLEELAQANREIRTRGSRVWRCRAHPGALFRNRAAGARDGGRPRPEARGALRQQHRGGDSGRTRRVTTGADYNKDSMFFRNQSPRSRAFEERIAGLKELGFAATMQSARALPGYARRLRGDHRRSGRRQNGHRQGRSAGGRRDRAADSRRLPDVSAHSFGQGSSGARHAFEGAACIRRRSCARAWASPRCTIWRWARCATITFMIAWKIAMPVRSITPGISKGERVRSSPVRLKIVQTGEPVLRQTAARAHA